MSAVVIAGNTSGTITLQAPAVAGSTTINLPTISGGSLLATDSSGKAWIGSAQQTGTSGTVEGWQLVGTSGPNSSSAQYRFTNDVSPPNYRFYKSRGTTVGSYTAVQNGDGLNQIGCWGSDGTGWLTNASTTIQSIVDGAVSTGIVPGRLEFNTQNSSGTSNLVGSFRADGNFQFNSGYGSAATAYGCRAWVNFNGTGTVAIRASGNVSSITDNGSSDYTVNLTTAMPDGNYAGVLTASARLTSGVAYGGYDTIESQTTSAFRFMLRNPSSGGPCSTEASIIDVAIFR